jgi:hypothetical protein
VSFILKCFPPWLPSESESVAECCFVCFSSFVKQQEWKDTVPNSTSFILILCTAHRRPGYWRRWVWRLSWIVPLCDTVQVHKLSRGTFCLHYQDDAQQAPLKCWWTTRLRRRCNPEDNHPQSICCRGSRTAKYRLTLSDTLRRIRNIEKMFLTDVYAQCTKSHSATSRYIYKTK